MLVLDVMKAKHGDCLLLRYGDNGEAILIDGGPRGVYPGLKQRLQALAKDNGLSLNLTVVSHIDDDHICGIIDFFNDLEKGAIDSALRPGALWHNSLTELLPADLAQSLSTAVTSTDRNAATVASFPQGNRLRQQASALNVAVNYPQSGKPISSATTIDSEAFNLAITILSPDQSQLDALKTKWQTHDKAAKAAACDDLSVYNLSSIVMLIEQGPHKLLLTGDARGDHVVAGLKAKGLVGDDGTYQVDLYKVSHHGSKHNSDPETFRTILADHYVLSGDRDRHPTNPGIEVIDWIVEARKERCPNREYTIWMTYDLPVLTERVSSPGKVEIIGANETYRSIILA